VKQNQLRHSGDINEKQRVVKKFPRGLLSKLGKTEIWLFCTVFEQDQGHEHGGQRQQLPDLLEGVPHDLRRKF